MKRTLLATTAALTLAVAAGPAFAGNIDEPIIAPAPAPMPAPVMMNTGGEWGGFYVGGSLGYADVTEDTAAFDDSGTTYGAHAGYNYDFGTFVVGGELEVSGFDVADGGIDVDRVARAKVRAGYDAGTYMPYLTAGYAQLSTGGALAADDDGVFYGLGMDYKLTDSIVLGGEVLKHDFDNYDGTGLNLDATTAALRVSFQF